MFQLPRIYPITDRDIAGLSHAEQVANLAKGGATLIQLRDKTATSRDFFHEAAKALTLARELGVKIIINDRVDIALSVSADGVHLGQSDMPPQAARRMLGDNAIIGLSTHNLQQALAAAEEPVDYIALGPIFSTTSKTDTHPVVGLDGLAKVRAAVSAQLVAIGGITDGNAGAVFTAGADSVALIHAILANRREIASRLTTLLATSAKQI